jgi:hypothetical protein
VLGEILRGYGGDELLAYARRWKPLKALLVVAAGTIPLAAFFAEHKVVKDERRAYEAAAASPAV